MNEILRLAAGEFCRWLDNSLPKLGPHWWQDNVVQKLTFQQQRLVVEKGVKDLNSLDLAALLRIFDQNWYELEFEESLPREARTWIKELQAVRNRWAHAPNAGLPPQDAFRDADTLSRILGVIGASEQVVSEVERYKRDMLSRLAPSSPAAEQTPQPSLSAADEIGGAKFSVGQLVCLRSNPSSIFPVLEVLASAGEVRYRVFENGNKNVYYESQLKALEESAPERRILSKTDLSALLTSIQLSSPSASALYSLNSGRITFVPYQYRPVFKLIGADRPRILVADEVGVGKTIEAGLIIKELQARIDIESVLIICPKPLVAERKWELEMKRFDEHFTPLNGQLLRHCINETHLDGVWPQQYAKSILPFSLIDGELLLGWQARGKTKDIGLLQLDPPPKFALVIVDEAHHIRNSDTFLHQAVRYFCDNAEAAIFLSATPVQLGSQDLFSLLNVLRPDILIDTNSFSTMAEPNRFINQAIEVCRHGEDDWAEQVRERLQEVAQTDWGRNVLSVNPGFQHIYDALAEASPDGASRIRTILSRGLEIVLRSGN